MRKISHQKQKELCRESIENKKLLESKLFSQSTRYYSDELNQPKYAEMKYRISVALDVWVLKKSMRKCDCELIEYVILV